jgi:hypothetical protein
VFDEVRWASEIAASRQARTTLAASSAYVIRATRIRIVRSVERTRTDPASEIAEAAP